jgi:ketosteroid isomerase-like protein
MSKPMAIVVFSALFCMNGCAAVKPELTEREAINSLSIAYAQAFESNQVERVLSVVTDDFVAITPDKPPVSGRRALKEAIENDFSHMKVLALHFKLDEVFSTGDWGFARGSSNGTIKMKATDQQVQLKGKFLWILRKNEKSIWKVARDSAFGDEPPK